jgi:cytochrome c oxidase subunit IV
MVADHDPHAAEADFSVTVFVHGAWKRLALRFSILFPPPTSLVWIESMIMEGDHTFRICAGASLR